ncbi:effector-associated domain EAD1-containing protein [Scytonema sp. NUACC26]|uniref:effector-associated domain EAD1-containing protein n=1 Tax=Scytonema sp. NUACC26 TaxID=3140176 RepID=UPI0034DC4664
MLSGQQLRELQNALIDAFPTKPQFEQMLFFELDKSLDTIARDNDLQETVFQLIKIAKAQGWLLDLARAACISNPGNLRLKAITQELLAPVTSSFARDTLGKQRVSDWHNITSANELVNEIENLKAKILDIRRKIFSPLKNLEVRDKNFKDKANSVIEKIGNISFEEEVKQLDKESLTKEIEALQKMHDQSLMEIKYLFEFISSALDRAEQMDITREQRVDDILDKIYPQTKNDE